MAGLFAEPEASWDTAIDAVCRQHPQHAEKLRARFGYLRWIAPVEAGAVAPSEPAAGDTFGDFLLQRRLGRGGMGVVWLAEQISLRRQVALKLVRPELLDSEKARQRFQREVELASRLDHPGLCAVLQAGEHEGQPWLAMRYVEGRSLASLLAARAPLAHGCAVPGEIAALVTLIEKVARAVHVAHEAGLVHRDIKPENILIGRDGEPVLVDFGLARAATVGATLTRSGDLLGTPAYLPPERVERGEFDRRGDVYALGTTLYHALTGRLPFESTSKEELFRAILTGEHVSARRLNRAIPRDLDVVLATAMDKDPARRYATALAFAEELRRIRLDEPIMARPAPPLLRARRWARRHPASTATIVLLAAGLSITSALLVERERAERRSFVLALVLQARQTLRTDQALALRVALEAHRLEDSARTRSLLHDALAQAHERAVLRGHGQGRIGGVVASRDDGTILTWSTDKTARLWSRDGAPGPVLPHPAAVLDATFTSGEQAVATACGDGMVRLFERSGRLLREWPARAKPVHTVAAVPGGSLLLTASEDGVARIWNEDGTLLQELTGNGAPLDHARVSRSGRWIVTAAQDGAARVYRRGPADRYEPWRVIEDHDRSVTITAFSADETLLLTAAGEMVAFARFRTGAHDRHARLWPLGAPDARAVILAGHDEALSRAAIAPDGTWIATGTNGGDVYLWTPQGERIRGLCLLPGEPVSSFAFSAGSDRLLACAAGEVVLLDRAGRPVAALRNHEECVIASAFTGDGRILTAGTTSVRISAERVAELPEFRGHAGAVYAARFTPGGRRVVTASRDGSAAVFDVVTGGMLQRLARKRETPAWVMDAAVPPGSEQTLSVSFGDQARDGRLRVWDPGGACVQTVVLPGGGARLAFAPDGSRCYVAMDTRDGGVVAFPFDGQRLGEPWPLPQPKGPCWGLAVGKDGKLLVTGTRSDSMVRVYDTSAWPPPEPREFSVKACGAIWSVALSPEGDHILVTGSDPTPRIYDLNGTKLAELPPHPGEVVCGTFSPDGNLVATGGDGVILSTADGTLLARFGSREAVPWTVEFSADGRFLLTGNMDGAARVWCVDPARLVELAEKYSRHRRLTAAECQRFGLPVSLARD